MHYFCAKIVNARCKQSGTHQFSKQTLNKYTNTKLCMSCDSYDFSGVLESDKN